MVEIREFTKQDWYAWAGAEPFKDGQPLICTKNTDEMEFVAIADCAGIGIYLYVEGGDQYSWHLLNRAFRSMQKVQRRLFEGVMEELDIEGKTVQEIIEELDDADGFERL